MTYELGKFFDRQPIHPKVDGDCSLDPDVRLAKLVEFTTAISGLMQEFEI